MQYYIASHRRDPDGICSAAILTRFAQLNNSQLELFFCDYVSLENDLQVINTHMKNGSFVILIDLGLDARLWPAVKSFLEKVKHKNIRVYWGDHHEWPDELIGKVRALGVKLDRSSSKEAVSTEIVKQQFLPQDPIAHRLSVIARDHDLWLRKDPFAMKLADMISYYNYLDNEAVTSPRLTELTYKLAKGHYWDGQMEAVHTEYLTKKKFSLKQSMDSAQVRKLGKFQVVFFYATTLISSTDAGNLALEQFSTDLSVGIWPDGRLGFRRTNKILDCSVIASLFDGGGHVFAAGAEWSDPIPEQEYPRVMELVKERIKHYLLL